MLPEPLALPWQRGATSLLVERDRAIWRLGECRAVCGDTDELAHMPDAAAGLGEPDDAELGVGPQIQRIRPRRVDPADDDVHGLEPAHGQHPQPPTADRQVGALHQRHAEQRGEHRLIEGGLQAGPGGRLGVGDGLRQVDREDDFAGRGPGGAAGHEAGGQGLHRVAARQVHAGGYP